MSAAKKLKVSSAREPVGDHVALFVPTLAGGGAERATVRLANGLVQSGFKVDLIVCDERGPNRSLLNNTVELVSLGVPRVRRAIGSLAAYLREKRPFALLSAMHHANLAAAIAVSLRKTNTAFLPIYHTRFAARRLSLRSYELRFVQKIAQSVVTVSQGVLEDLSRHVPSSKLRCIYNPTLIGEERDPGILDARVSTSIGSADPVIAAVGRLEHVKAFDVLIRAFGRIVHETRARLVIAGDGACRSELEALIRSLGLADRVYLPGYVGNPRALFARADVAVLSSRREGFPTVLVEAMSVGTPIVATDCVHGPREMLRDTPGTWLVPVDNERELGSAMLAALAYPKVDAALVELGFNLGTRGLRQYSDLLESFR